MQEGHSGTVLPIGRTFTAKQQAPRRRAGGTVPPGTPRDPFPLDASEKPPGAHLGRRNVAPVFEEEP